MARTLQSSVGIKAVATEKEISLRRYLAEGDFQAFNDLLVGATIDLPDARVKTGRLTLDLKSPYCQDIEIGDILLTHDMESNQRFTFTVKIVNLKLKCYSDYDYSWRFVDGDGEIYARVQDTSAESILSFASPNFNTNPPTSSNVDSCVAEVNIADLDFSGGIVNSLLDTFEGSFRGLISDEIETGRYHTSGDHTNK